MRLIQVSVASFRGGLAMPWRMNIVRVVKKKKARVNREGFLF